MREGRDLSKLTDRQLHAELLKAAEQAVNAQNACNLSGVVYMWAEVMDVICELDARGRHAYASHGTEWKNRHPVNVLFAAKCAELTPCGPIGGVNNYQRALKQCEAWKQEKNS